MENFNLLIAVIKYTNDISKNKLDLGIIQTRSPRLVLFVDNIKYIITPSLKYMGSTIDEKIESSSKMFLNKIINDGITFTYYDPTIKKAVYCKEESINNNYNNVIGFVDSDIKKSLNINDYIKILQLNEPSCE